MPGLSLPVIARTSPMSPAAKPPPGPCHTRSVYLSFGGFEPHDVAELVKSLVGVVVQGRDVGFVLLELSCREQTRSSACPGGSSDRPGPGPEPPRRRKHSEHDRQSPDVKFLHVLLTSP